MLLTEHSRDLQGFFVRLAPRATAGTTASATLFPSHLGKSIHLQDAWAPCYRGPTSNATVWRHFVAEVLWYGIHSIEGRMTVLGLWGKPISA